MKKTLHELRQALDENQSFITAFDTAQMNGLSLTADMYDKYSDALERQKALAKELSDYENGRNGMVVSAVLGRKEPEIRTEECAVEAVEEIPHSDFLWFKDHLLDDYNFISDHLNDMYRSRTGVSHCLLVMDGDGNDGILVESEGSSYARYSGLLPDARIVLRHHMQPVADYLIGEERRSVTCEELHDLFQMDIQPGNFFGKLLTETLLTQKEINAVIAREDSFELDYAPVHALRVGDLMNVGLEDVHLLDMDEEHDVATIVELNRNTLTEAGWDDWDDVLSAKVERIYEGSYGLQIDVSGCDPQRLKDFSYMLAGYCSEEDYERWVSSDEDLDQDGPALQN